MVVPIQVYKDTNGVMQAWDGQHTLLTLWIIATQIFDEDPNTLTIPINLYKSNQKSEMRHSFISHNGGDGKLKLDAIDIFEQQVFGIRVDKSTNPDWAETEQKQTYLEEHGLFVTAAKFGDTHMPGAITRLQEINKMHPISVKWLSQYLSAVGCTTRPAVEKEVVMMGYFFDKCRIAKINVTDSYIAKLANVTTSLWGADFSPTSRFWVKAERAYKNWHTIVNTKLDANGKEIETSGKKIEPRFDKNPPQGMPFLLAQLKKSFDGAVFESQSSSEFTPAVTDLF